MDSKSLTKTGFCNKEIDNVTDNDMKAYILQNLQTKTKINYDTRYAKMYNENYSKNLNNPHLVCLKSLGSPYLLYCTQINDVNYCFLIDKKVKDGYKHPKIFLVHYRFNNDIFKGTLFETELLRDNNNKWHLLIGDIYTYKGETMILKQITERMNIINTIILDEYIDDTFCNICPIMIKRYFDINKIQYILENFIDSLNYRLRGFYFIPLKCSYSKIIYLFPREDNQKINFKKKDTVNFKIVKTIKSDIYELYLNNETGNSIIKYDYACIPNITTSEWIKKLTDEKENSIVECKINKRFNKWMPIKEGNTIDIITMMN